MNNDTEAEARWELGDAEYKMSPEDIEERVKADCRKAVKTLVKEVVSWNGLSARTRDEVMRVFGHLWHKYPEEELDVDWCFDFSGKENENA